MSGALADTCEQASPPSSDLYAVIGNPVAHSKSPTIHHHFAQSVGHALHYERVLAPMDSFAATVDAFRARGGRGANVTVPFKTEAFEYATQRSPRAELAGAVNTLRFDGENVFGDNTDGAGLVEDLRQHAQVDWLGKRVLLIGAGGAAMGVAGPMIEAGISELIVVNRTLKRAQSLVERLRTRGVRVPQTAPEAGDLPRSPTAGLLQGHAMKTLDGRAFSDLGALQFDIIINASSVGLSGEALPLPDPVFAPGALALEMVYGRDTSFLAQARTAGARTRDGLGMLVMQAVESFRLWRGITPPAAAISALFTQLR